MNEEIAKLWAADLRDGGHKQGKSSLCTITADGDEFCCLGRLCELAVAAGIIPAGTKSFNEPHQTEVNEYGDESATAYLPFEVQEWAGIADERGNYRRTRSLSFDNDDGATFAQIADTIEANVTRL